MHTTRYFDKTINLQLKRDDKRRILKIMTLLK